LPAERGQVAVAVAAQPLDAREQIGVGTAAIEDGHLVVAFEGGLDEVSTEEGRPTQDQELHRPRRLRRREALPLPR
jgi:hypothetical protein